MKVTLNQTLQINNIWSKSEATTKSSVSKQSVDSINKLPLNTLSLANFPNISFRRNADVDFLLSQAKNLRCAYSGITMLSQAELKEIFTKLEKRTNAQSAINLLQNYESYMHDIESIIFDILKDASHKTKRDFQDILLELKPESLLRLAEKQKNIIKSTDKIIRKMSPDVAKQVEAIRDSALQKIEDNSFGRQPPLEMIKAVKATGTDLDRVIRVYQAWYKLPYSATDLDAFIVKYSRKPHADIARRLLSSSVATVEHIQPSSCGGGDELGNFLLVSARFNNERHSMPLDEYIMLNSEIDIKKNLQQYIDDIIDEMRRKKSTFHHRSWYPNKIKKVINRETSGRVCLNTDALRLTREQVRENTYSERLKEKFLVTMK